MYIPSSISMTYSRRNTTTQAPEHAHQKPNLFNGQLQATIHPLPVSSVKESLQMGCLVQKSSPSAAQRPAKCSSHALALSASDGPISTAASAPAAPPSSRRQPALPASDAPLSTAANSPAAAPSSRRESALPASETLRSTAGSTLAAASSSQREPALPASETLRSTARCQPARPCAALQRVRPQLRHHLRETLGAAQNCALPLHAGLEMWRPRGRQRRRRTLSPER